MSSMLEQAIVDAEQLKDTARQTAEEAVVEKYQDEIREAVEKILEQDEDILGDAAFGGDLEEGAEDDTSLEFAEDLPSAHITKEEKGDEVVTIDLNKLEEMMAEEMESGDGLDASDMVNREEIAEEIENLDEDDDETVELDEADLAEVLAELMAETETDETETVEEVVDEDVDVVEEVVDEDADVVEEDQDNTTEDTELQNEAKDLKDKNTSLLKEQKKQKAKYTLLENKLKKFNTITNKLKEKLEESNLLNAKLLYQNRILDSVSLNERQRNKIAETISDASTVEEVKIIFETLQSAVGTSAKKRKMPESLNEAVSRSSSAFLPRKEEKQKVDPFTERMRILAGLKNN